MKEAALGVGRRKLGRKVNMTEKFYYFASNTYHCLGLPYTLKDSTTTGRQTTIKENEDLTSQTRSSIYSLINTPFSNQLS